AGGGVRASSLLVASACGDAVVISLRSVGVGVRGVLPSEGASRGVEAASAAFFRRVEAGGEPGPPGGRGRFAAAARPRAAPGAGPVLAARPRCSPGRGVPGASAGPGLIRSGGGRGGRRRAEGRPPVR